MKKIYTLLAALFLIINAWGQTPSYQWANKLEGSSTSFTLQVNDIDVDKTTNEVYIVGSFRGTVDFDPSSGIFNVVSSTGGFDSYFIAKYTPSGALIWVNKFGSTSYQNIYDIKVDNSSNIYVSGTFDVTMDFDPGPGNASLATGSGTGYIAKYDQNGNFLWVNATSGYATSIAFDSSNNIFVSSMYTGGYSLYKFNSSGTQLTISGAYSGSSTMPVDIRITTDAADNVFLAIGFGTDLKSVGNFTLTSAGGNDIALIKYGNNLVPIWADRIGGTGNDCVVTNNFRGGIDLAIDNSNNICLVGGFTGTCDFNPSAATQTIVSASPIGDGYIAKYDNTTGSLIFAEHLTSGSTSHVLPNRVIIDSYNFIHVFGSLAGTADFDPSSSNLAVSGNSGSGGHSLFLSKFDAAGGVVYAYSISSIPTSGTINSHSFCMTNSSIFICGSLRPTYPFDFDLTSGTANITPSYNAMTGFFAKYNYCDFAPTSPVLINGSTSICLGNSPSYSVNPIVDATSYSWSLPGGWSGTSTTNTISVTVGSSGTMSVTATNDCGTSSAQTLSVTVNALPTISVNSGAICSGQSFTMSPSGASTYTYSGGSAVVSPTANATYSVSGTSAAGCVSASSAISSVTVNAKPTITVNSGSICSGQSFTMSPSGASTYTYSGGSSVVSPTANATYSVSGTSAAGCVSASSAVSSVTVNTKPTITVNSGSICSGQSFTMSPSGASTYTFSGGSAVVSPTANASYSVSGTSAAGCVSASSAVSSVTVNALPTISVNSGAICSGQSFTMSPSGASTYTYSSGSAVVSPATTTSYSVTGTSAAGCLGSNTAVSTVTVTGTLTVTISGSNTVCNGQAVNLTAGGASTYSWNTGSTSSTIAPTPTTTTTYSVIGSSGSCSNTAVTTVTVNTLPTISVNSGTICSGQSFTMSPSGASTYTYSGSSAVVSPTANATYSVSGTSAAGCISASSAVSNITVNALPIVNATTSNTLMCTGETVTLTASGATSYTFNPGGVGASVVVSPTVTSNYTVSGTAANGCNNTTVLTQSVSLCTGIQPVVQSIEANVYPNPFKNKINVMVSAAKQTIVVYNALGQAVYTAPSPSEKAGDEIVIDLTNQPSGIYFIKIDSITKKLIKE
jgi:hypothetical protein